MNYKVGDKFKGNNDETLVTISSISYPRNEITTTPYRSCRLWTIDYFLDNFTPIELDAKEFNERCFNKM